MAARKQSLAERLDRWTRLAGTGCFEWTGALDRDGYGAMKVDGRMRRAPRIAYELAHGPIPEGAKIHHRCRNRACVNPEHLELVTTAENNHRRSEDHRAEVQNCPRCGGSDWAFYSRPNVRPARYCRRCRNTAQLARYHARKARG